MSKPAASVCVKPAPEAAPAAAPAPADVLLRTFAPGSDPCDVLQREYQVVRELDHPLILKTYPPLCDGELAVLPMRLWTKLPKIHG